MPCLVQGKKRSTNLLKPTSDKSLSHSRCPQVLSGANMSQCQLARPKAQCHNGRHAAEDEAQDHGDSQVYVPRSKTKAVLAGLHRKTEVDRIKNQSFKATVWERLLFSLLYTVQHPTCWITVHTLCAWSSGSAISLASCGNTNCARVGITCNQMISHLFISSYSFDTKIANLCKFYQWRNPATEITADVARMADGPKGSQRPLGKKWHGRAETSRGACTCRCQSCVFFLCFLVSGLIAL